VKRPIAARGRHSAYNAGSVPAAMRTPPIACRHSNSSAWREPETIGNNEVYAALTCEYYGLSAYPPTPRYPARDERADFNCSTSRYGVLYYGTFQGPFPGLLPRCRRDPAWCPISDVWTPQGERLKAWRNRLPGAPAVDGISNSSRSAREWLHQAPLRQLSGGTVPCSLLRRCPGLQDFGWYSGHGRRLSACLRQRRLVMLGDSTLGESMMELVLLLTADVPEFGSMLLGLEWKVRA